VLDRAGRLVPWDVPRAFADLRAVFLENGPAPPTTKP
jgi:hypothetical protein